MDRPTCAAAVLVALALTTSVSPTHAGERCQPPDHLGNVTCEVGIPSDRLEPITSQQAMSQWCWAASISMIFGYHGHALPQERIVQSVFGQLVDLPAMNGMVMSRSLARPWTDAKGRPFQAKVRVFDVHAGQFEVDTNTIIAELREERPLLVGTVGHAMVMTAMRYVRSPWGQLQVIGATVRDPWPGRGRRDLQWHEMQPQYLATVDLGKKRPTEARPLTTDPETPLRPGPVTVPTTRPTPADMQCIQSCSLHSRQCQASLPTLDVCVRAAVDACVNSCTYDYGYPPMACQQQCHPHNGINRRWQGECEGYLSMAVTSCRDGESQCLARCD